MIHKGLEEPTVDWKRVGREPFAQDGLRDYEVALSSFQVSAWHSDQALREHQKGSK